MSLNLQEQPHFGALVAHLESTHGRGNEHMFSYITNVRTEILTLYPSLVDHTIVLAICYLLWRDPQCGSSVRDFVINALLNYPPQPLNWIGFMSFLLSRIG